MKASPEPKTKFFLNNQRSVNYIRELREPGDTIIATNLQHLLKALGTNIPAFLRIYKSTYNCDLSYSKIFNIYRDPHWSISFMYVRALEIGLILIYGYKIRCFDLIRYDFSKDPLPGIIPVEFRRLWVENKIDRDSV